MNVNTYNFRKQNFTLISAAVSRVKTGAAGIWFGSCGCQWKVDWKEKEVSFYGWWQFLAYQGLFFWHFFTKMWKNFGVGPQKMQSLKIPLQEAQCVFQSLRWGPGPSTHSPSSPKAGAFQSCWEEERPGSLSGHLRAHTKGYCSGRERLAEAWSEPIWGFILLLLETNVGEKRGES